MNAGWQWSAGCGCDAQPWFRIFNPVTQGERFDPDGTYVRAWVPEIAKLDNRHIHAPWRAPRAVLAAAGVRLDRLPPLGDRSRGRAAAFPRRCEAALRPCVVITDSATKVG